MFDKGFREELTFRERHELALEAGPVRRAVIRERAVIAVCDRVLAASQTPVHQGDGPVSAEAA